MKSSQLRSDTPPLLVRLTAAATLLAFTATVVADPAGGPPWWYHEDPAMRVIDPNREPDNKAAANIGQAKWMAIRALEELEKELPGPAANVRNRLFGTPPQGENPGTPGIFDPDAPATDAEREAQKAPLLLGQLKNIAQPFYDELHLHAPTWSHNRRVANGTANAGSTKYPWDEAAPSEANRLMANLGQLKAVFALDFHSDGDADGFSDLREEALALPDGDGDGIPDIWELENGMDQEDPADALLDSDRDGYSNLQEFKLNTNPKGVPTYRVHEVGLFPQASAVSWSPTGFGGDATGDHLFMWATPSAPLVDGPTRAAYWTLGKDEEAGEFGFYPSYGTSASSLLARSPEGAVAATLSDEPATLVFWDSATSSPRSIEGTDTIGGSNTRRMEACQLSPGAKYMVGWRVIHGTGAGSHFIWRMPAPGQPFSTTPTTLTLPAGASLESGATLYVNDHGVVAANVTSGGVTRVVTWRLNPDGTSVTASLLSNLPQGTTSTVLGLSNSAEPFIVGNGNKSASGPSTGLVWNAAGAVSELGIPGGSSSWTTAVSPSGIVSGVAQVDSGAGLSQQTFLARFHAGSGIWRIAPQGDAHYQINHYGLTDAGELLGSARGSATAPAAPMLWRHGLGHEISLPRSSGYVLGATSAINTNGALHASAVRNGISVRVVLTPVADTDSDGMPDDFELSHGLEAFKPDGDGDPDDDDLFNREEFEHGTDPKDRDSDSDGMDDKWEVDWGLLPLDAADADLDPDGDRVTNVFECDLDTPPTGLYRLKIVTLAADESCTSVADDGSFLTSRSGDIVDFSDQVIQTGTSYKWYGPWVSPGTPRVQRQVPLGNWESDDIPGEIHYGIGDFKPTRQGRVTGFHYSAVLDANDHTVLEENQGFLSFNPATGAGELLNWTPIATLLEWSEGPNFGAESPEGKRRLLVGSTKVLVLDESGVKVSELPISGASGTYSWLGINDQGDAVGISSGGAKIYWDETSATNEVAMDLEPPADWGSDPWGFHDYRVSEDLRTIVYRTVQEASGLTHKEYYVANFVTNEFRPLALPGLSESEPIVSLSKGGRVLGDGLKPWQHSGGSTVLIETLKVELENPSSTLRVRELGWKTCSAVGISNDGEITLRAIQADGTNIVAQLKPVTDKEPDGLPDDWEKYWAKHLQSVVANPSQIPTNLDPDEDYLGNGIKTGAGYTATQPQATEVSDAIQVYIRRRHAEHAIQRDYWEPDLEGQNKTEGSRTWRAYVDEHEVVSPRSEVAGANETGNPTNEEALGSLDREIPFSIIPLIPAKTKEFTVLSRVGEDEGEPSVYENEDNVEITEYWRRWGSSIQDAGLTLMAKEPVWSPVTRHYIKTQRNNPLVGPLGPLTIAGVATVTIPKGRSVSDMLYAAAKPGTNAEELVTVAPLSADIEVLSSDLGITSVEGPASHRKISLFASPAKDGKPSELPESDTPEEEVYVDAYDRSLVFNTSLAWVPQGSSELPLSINLRYNPTSIPYIRTQLYNSVTKQPDGFRESLGMNAELFGGMFGMGFSSNLSGGIAVDSNITTYTAGADKQFRSRISGYKVDVVDSDGVPHRFTSRDLTSFSKEPGQVAAAAGQITTLAWTDAQRTHLVLTHKYGKKCIYRWTSGPVQPPTSGYNPGDGQGLTQSELGQYTLRGAAELSEVHDRFGNKLVYLRDGNTLRIRHIHKDLSQAGGYALQPSGEILVTLAGGLVQSITDPRGKVTQCRYETRTVGLGLKRPVLSKIISPDGSVRKFGMYLDLRRPKTYNPQLPKPQNPTSPFSYSKVKPPGGKKWTTGDALDMAIAPYLRTITDASGVQTEFSYGEPTQVDAAKRIMIKGTVSFGSYETLPGASVLNASRKQQIIRDAKIEASPDIAAEMAMKGYFKLPTAPTPDPNKPFEGDLYNDDPYSNAEGIYFRYGLTSAPAVEKVTRSDIDGDGAPEIVTIGQQDHFKDLMTATIPANVDPTSSGLPAPTGPDNRPLAKYRTTTVKDSKGSTSYGFGDVIIVSYGRQETTQPGSIEWLGTGDPVRVPPAANGFPPACTAATMICRRLTIARSATGGGEVSETYFFNPLAGMALAGAVDASGNLTTYTHDDPFDQGTGGGPEVFIGSSSLGQGIHQLQQFHSDPKSQTRSKGSPLTGGVNSSAGTFTRKFSYTGDLRLQTKVVDERNVVTVQSLNSKNLRQWEKVYADEASAADPNAIPLRWETFGYNHSKFPMFLTEHRIKKIPGAVGDPSWAEDLVTTYEPDANGRLWKEKVAVSGGELVTIHTYDANGNKKTVTSPRGLLTSFEYDDMNRLKRIIYDDPVSPTSKGFEYDAGGRKTAEVDEKGNRTSYKYNAGGLPVEVRMHMNAGTADSAADIVTKTKYDSRGRAIAVTDANGSITTTQYDSLDRPVLVRDALGNETAFHYDLAKNAGGSLFESSSFKPTRTRDPRGFVTEITYDHRYKPLKVAKEYTPSTSSGDWRTRPLSSDVAVTETAYDATGNPTDTYIKRSATAALASAEVMHTHVDYDALGRAYLTTVEPGTSLAHSTETLFTSTGLAWKTIEFKGISALERASEKEYDRAGRVVKEWSSAASSGAINKQTNPTTQLTPDYSACVTTDYDADGNVSYVTDPRGNTTNYEYDSRNRKVKELLPAVAVYGQAGVARPEIVTRYDAVGNVEEIEDALDVVTRTSYDRANRPWKVEAALGTATEAETVTAYDKNGNVIAVTDPNGNTTRNAYDALNRLIGTSVNPATGNPGWPTAPASGDIVVANVYDKVGNLVRVADGAAPKSWSAAGWEFTNPAEGHITGFVYDGLNRKTDTVWDIGSDRERYNTLSYDAAVMTSRLDPMGRKTTYGYDGLFRLASTSYWNTAQPSAVESVETRYYKSSSPSATVVGPGPLRAVWYGDGSGVRDVTYRLDRLGRTTSETSGGANHDYFYDLAGNRVGTRYHSKSTAGVPGTELRVLISEYDSNNRVSKIHETTRTGIDPYAFTLNPATDKSTAYFYDIAGKVRSKSLPNGQLTVTEYDVLGRSLLITTTANAALVSQSDYRTPVANSSDPSGYDRGGNLRRVAETSSNLPARTIVNDYDCTYRLVRETTSGSAGTVETEYEYDAANNRTLKAVTGGSTPGTWVFTYGTPSHATNPANSNQLVSYTRPSNGLMEFEYDLCGNRVKAKEAGTLRSEYSYDLENRLLQYKRLGPDARTDNYSYDYRSRRVVRDESGAASGNGTQVLLSFSGGSSVQEYAPAQTLPAAEHIRGSDWGGGVGGILYTVRGGASSFCAYNSRGDVVSRSDSSGGVTWQASYEAFGTRTANYGSTTERQTANTKDEDLSGLLNEGMRYRDLEAGVFLTRDPAGFVDGPNLYTYVRQDPWSAFDPLGLQAALLDDDELNDQEFIDKLNEDEGRYALDEEGSGRLYDILDEFGVESTKDLKDVDIESSRAARRKAAWSLYKAWVEEGKTKELFERQQIGPWEIEDWTLSRNLGLGYANKEMGEFSAELITAPLNPASLLGKIPLLLKGSKVASAVPAAAKGGAAEARLWSKAEFQGTRVYQRNDLIDATLVDARGRTNLQRMQSGLAPVGPDGKSINLHHTIQTNDGPVAEMTATFHQQNSSVIHINPNTIPSGIDRKAFDAFRRDYWMNRANDFSP